MLNEVMDNRTGRVNFKSYIIIDLETTTLPCYDTPRITELCAVGVIRDHILKLSEGELQPRVVNKLSLCFHPGRVISVEAERLTGLSNTLLESSSTFSENTFQLFEGFINTMKKPVCLVAHNGNRFDYPVLQSELRRIKKNFQDDVWCADSLPGFRHFFLNNPIQPFLGRHLSCDPSLIPPLGNIKENSHSSSEPVAAASQQQRTHLRNFKDTRTDLQMTPQEDSDAVLSMFDNSEEYDSALYEAVESVERNLLSQKVVEPLVEYRGEVVNLMECDITPEELHHTLTVTQIQKLNETTPKRQHGHFVPKVAKVCVINSKNCPTPEQINYEGHKQKKVTRSLEGKLNKCNDTRPRTFTLTDIFMYTCKGKPFTAHCAESDAIMLLQSIVACRYWFVDWLDKNAKPFNHLNKKYRSS